MFNILLDPLPTQYEGFPIDSDFQTGIQILQALEDPELTTQERIWTSVSLLFAHGDDSEGHNSFPDAQTAVEGLMWFLTEWDQDRHAKEGGDPVTDYAIDQWRIYSGFRQHYGINLNTDKLHFWEFMGLLTTLPECAYTRVVDIRAKKMTAKMGREERDAYKRLKEIYALKRSRPETYTEEQTAAIDEYDRMTEEQKRIRESRKMAKKAFEDMVR